MFEIQFFLSIDSFYSFSSGKYVEPSELHADTFKGAERKFRKPKGVTLARDRHNRPQTVERLRTSEMQLRSRTFKKVNAFKALGIDYELPSVIITKVTN